MKPIEVRETTWKAFCEAFTRLNQGSLVTIEMLDGKGRRTDIARDIPLDKMSLDKNSDCSDRIVINASETGKRGIDHQVIEPIHVIIRENTEHTKILQITAENGTTLVTFHSGQTPTSVLGAAAVERCVL